MPWGKIATFLVLIIGLAVGIWYTCFRKDKEKK